MRGEREENNTDPADRIKSTAVIGFMGADPIAKCFMILLSIFHPSKTNKGITKTIHPNALEQFLRKLILVFTCNPLKFDTVQLSV